MRFAITAVDRNVGVYDALLTAGWEPVKLFTSRTSNGFDFSDSVVRLAEEQRIPIQLSRMTDDDLAELHKLECEILVCASYNWKIPDWRPYLQHGINFHPSPLPYGRGPQPTVRAILDNWGAWAVTCHRLEARFDRGDILASEPFPLGDDETFESIDLKVQMVSRRLAFAVASNFTALWEAAAPQGQGSYWPLWTESERVINFDQRVSEVLRHVRAFGAIEAIAQISGATLLVRRAVGWREIHSLVPGSLVHGSHDQVVIAVADGYVGLTEWRLERRNPLLAARGFAEAGL